MRFALFAGTALLALTVAGCGSDSAGPSGAPADPSALDADVATIAGDAAAQDIEVMNGPGGNRFALGLVHNDRRFACDTLSRGPITVTRTCVFRDGAGNVQPSYDSLATASASFTATIDGSFDRQHLSGSVHRVSEVVVTGLEGTETSRTWNGSGHGSISRVHTRSDGTTRSYEIAESFTVSNVVIPVPRGPGSWPTAGTITRVLTITKNDGSTITRTVTVTFDGTQVAKVTLDGERYDFDLSARGRCRRDG